MTTYLALLLSIAACGGPSDRPGNTGDSGNDPTGDGNGSNGDGCPDEAKSVYVVDQNNEFSRFDPPTQMFTDLGKLTCQASGTPFSMGVDRTATAYVLYSSGELFKVDTTAAGLPCTKTAWTSVNLRQFGMGFSSDAAGSTTDTLFIAGGNTGPTQPTSQLAKVPLSTFQAQGIGGIQGWPELTGTGNAELWGFFPDETSPRISKIDKTNGMALTTYPLTISGTPRAWAFAFWGGDFWVFLMKGNTETSTTIYQYDAATGMPKGSKAAPGRTIVGAGVSTCAPVIL
jgi:hypothetical protein